MSAPDNDFFIGWGETSKIDRRFLLFASLGLVTLAAGGAALLASEQAAPGDGSWNPDDERNWAGVLVPSPFPMLRTTGIDGLPRTAFLVSSNKLGVQTRLDSIKNGPVVVRGSLIARGKNAMIAVADGSDWLTTPFATAPEIDRVADIDWQERDLGPASYIGEILDSKCWFGAMQPGQGKPHKSCAALCIRGGLPPVFCADGLCGSAETAPLLTDANGNPHGPELLPFVGDLVLASGRHVKVGDVTQFRVALTDIKRV